MGNRKAELWAGRRQSDGSRGTVGTRGACREWVLGWGPMWEQVWEIGGAHGRVRVRKTISGHSQNMHLVKERKKPGFLQ